MGKFFQNIFLRVNNGFLRWRKGTYDTNTMMILLPRCLQHSACTQNVVEESDNCKRCGRCPVGDVVEVGRRQGTRVLTATGGLMAREYVRRYQPRLIIAVACENELLAGMFKVFPRPVYALINSRPHGPCKDTQINPDEVEKVICMFTPLEVDNKKK
ncbi:MAG: DUF116 domain-containing protein [Candidatus Omnitrophica bacterium]|nr:DUF116 domain-containing protein [Candidatus Omnitrophota bacterium]